MSVAWTVSPVYGKVILGPAQADVLRAVRPLTRNGRRPELTLGRLAAISGRPVSSVHDALGRLRALGILGVSARMGRRGGHRLWSMAGLPSAARELDGPRHRTAIARIVARYQTRPSGHARSNDGPTSGGESGSPPPAAPPLVIHRPGAPDTRSPERPSFGDRLRREAERQGLLGLRDMLDEWGVGKR